MGFFDGIGGAAGAIVSPASAMAVVGSLGSGYMQMQGQKETNEANRDIASDQMAFQDKMSSTAYQRATADMKAAGLNPMLAYQQGGASTPSGASAQMQNENTGFAQGMENAVSNAMEARRLQKELDATDSQIKLNAAAEKTQAEQAKLNTANARVAQQNENVIKAELPAIQAQARADQKTASWDEKMSGYDAVTKRITSGANSAKSILDIINPFTSGGVSKEIGKKLKPSEIIQRERARNTQNDWDNYLKGK